MEEKGKKKSRFRTFLRWALFVLIAVLAFGGIVMMTINNHVIRVGKEQIIGSLDSEDDTFTDKEIRALKKQNADCILVLGAGISDSETPSPVLRDRLDTAIALYKAGVAPKILMSGDNGTTEHNETHVMLKYAEKKGVPPEDIFCDHAGFSTYDSVYRAREIFEVKSMIIVTQTYHLYRALYVSDKLGVKAVGCGADQKDYSGQAYREIREVVARNKDFFKVRTGAKATYGGEVIPITGSGEASHGE